ncbi:unnamed protein product, partial [Ceratitis capitata]
LNSNNTASHEIRSTQATPREMAQNVKIRLERYSRRSANQMAKELILWSSLIRSKRRISYPST